MSEDIARAALGKWGLGQADMSLVAQRENIVFRIRHGSKTWALRLHRPGYQSRQMVQSELAWMQYLDASGLNVPKPVPACDGAVLHKVRGHHADILTWMGGRPLGATGTPLDLPDRQGTFRQLGQLMARMHAVSDDWARPQGFNRQSWDLDGLLGEAPLWGRFWDNPGLSASWRDKVLQARDKLWADLSGLSLDYGLIHADMLRENVLIDGDRLGLIDFDDSGFGFRLFDVATTLFKNRGEPDYLSLESAFLEGYRSVRALDSACLGHFMLIRSLSYLGWIITRGDEPGAQARQARFLKAALPLVDVFLQDT